MPEYDVGPVMVCDAFAMANEAFCSPTRFGFSTRAVAT